MSGVMNFLSSELNGGFSPMQLLDFSLRIVLAMACGGVIGFERTRRFKGAGLRTHMIVCCASALFMIISKYGFLDVPSSAFGEVLISRNADPARVAAQVVSGISFLGAGVIFKNRGSVSGLTTAAGLWATSGIGLAMGGGMYVLGILTTVLIALFQYLLHRFRIGADSMPLYQISFTVMQSVEFQKELDAQLAEWSIHMVDTKMVKKEGGKISYDISLRASYRLSTKEILSFFNNRDEVISVSVINP